MATSQTIGAGEIHAAIERLAAAIAERHRGTPNLLLLGIANGGVELARRLALNLSKRLASTPPAPGRSKPSIAGNPLVAIAGTVDISFHRDDIGRHPIPKEFAPTHIPADVAGAAVILVDDVLFSGRTVKAALDELFDHGRPAKVELAILVDRGGRLLPIAADYTGLTIAPPAQHRVTVFLDPRDARRDLLRIEPAKPARPAPLSRPSTPARAETRKSPNGTKTSAASSSARPAIHTPQSATP